MSVFKVGDLVVTYRGIVFEVEKIEDGYLFSGGRSYGMWICRHLKPLDDAKEIQLVDKSRSPVFDPSRCDMDLRNIDIVAMDANGWWHGYKVLPGCGGFIWAELALYQGTPSPLWRETKTYIGGNK